MIHTALVFANITIQMERLVVSFTTKHGRHLFFFRDLPGLGLHSRTVPSFKAQPSTPGASFPDSPAVFPGTIRARGHIPGRSAPFEGDLPRLGPFPRTVTTPAEGEAIVRFSNLHVNRFLFKFVIAIRKRYPGGRRHSLLYPNLRISKACKLI